MLCLKKLKELKNNQFGTMSIPLIIFMLIAVIIFLYGLELFGTAIEYQNVSYSAKSITKVIECEGAVTDRAYKQMQALNDNFGMDMKFYVSDVNYFDNRVKTIQFRDPFKVTVKYTSEIQLISPLFMKPIVWKIDMASDVAGMSEVYWK